MTPPPTPRARRAPAPDTAGVRDGMPVADQVVHALRLYAATTADVTHHLARWLGVGTADAEAFGQVLYAEDRGTPTSPTVLGRHVGLTTGATTALVDRLAAAGLVVRSREHLDRRVVTLRVPPEVKERAVLFFAPFGDRVDALMDQHPDELLRRVVVLLDELRAAVAEVVEEFEAAPPARDAPRPPGAPPDP